MQSKATSPDEYLAGLPADRKEAMEKLRKTLAKNLPKGFKETMAYGMLCYVVPHTIYPQGYHCKPEQALPFISLASQKNFIALYHMGIYADPQLLKWFTDEYSKTSKTKIDMGKSCIRFKKPDQIPFTLIGQLAAKMSPVDWIKLYETNLKKA
jgi:uncharacterized protein YdhG (YjbR/CyaY superfamily)